MIKIGVDEVGRGALAGPVIAAAVTLPNIHNQPIFFDSKSLGFKKREFLYDWIMDHACVAIGWASAKQIDRTNILKASLKAMNNVKF